MKGQGKANKDKGENMEKGERKEKGRNEWDKIGDTGGR